MTISMWRLAAIVTLAAASIANAAPPFSGGDLPGRERDRFVDPPIGRMIQQPPSVAPRFDGPAEPARCRRQVSRRAKSHRSVRSSKC
jgi:hypothetical protein